MGRPLDFVLHNAGSHNSDAAALNNRADTNVPRPAAQTGVTGKVQAKFHNRLITPLGSYPQRFGKAAPGEKQTLKVKVHH